MSIAAVARISLAIAVAKGVALTIVVWAIPLAIVALV